jgi:hypothetical protein
LRFCAAHTAAKHRRGFTFGEIAVDWDISAVPASERSAYTDDSYEHDTAAAASAADRDDDGSGSSNGDHEGNEDPATAVYLVVSCLFYVMK